MSVFVDSSALYAFLDRGDRHHQAAVTAFQSLFGHDELVTHNYVVVETATLTSRRLEPSVVRRLMEDVLPAIDVHWVDRAVHGAAVTALLAAGRRRVSLVDWVSFEVMRQLGITAAFAFDRDFKAQGFEVVP